MLEKIIAEKLKGKIKEPINSHDFRIKLVNTRFSRKDAGIIMNEMKKHNMITVRRKQVWLR